MLCSQAKIVKYGQGMTSAKLLKCRSWQCEICRPDRAKQLVAMAIKGQAKIFITLTVRRGDPETVNERCKELIAAWRKVRSRACKKYGYKSIPFLAVVEAQKSGEPHLHIIARVPWIEQAWLSQQMHQLINSPICWIETVQSRRKLANYVAKYCGKDPHKFGTCKRYWTSADWLAKDTSDDEPVMDRSIRWEQQPGLPEDLIHIWNRLGYKTRWRRPWFQALHPHHPDYREAENEFAEVEGCYGPHDWGPACGALEARREGVRQ